MPGAFEETGVRQSVAVGHGLSVDRDDDVACLETRLRGRAAGHDVGDQSAVLILQVEAPGQVFVHGLDLNAQPAADDMPLLPELRKDLLDLVDRKREAHARVLRGAAGDDQ